MRNSIEQYVSDMRSRFGSAIENDPTQKAAGEDSSARNYIARRLQHLTDNGYDLGEGGAFLDSIGSKDPYGSYNMYNGDSTGFLVSITGGGNSSLGNDEVSAIAYAMMQMDALQADGRMNADEYAAKMAELVSPESIGEIKAHGGDGFYNFLDDLEWMEKENEPDPEVAAANQARFSVGVRTYINDGDDYLNDAIGRDHSHGDTKPDGYNIYDDMEGQLRNAKNAGLLTDDQYEAARNRMRDYSDKPGEPGKADETLLYAMKDAMALGDPDMVARVMSPEGITAISGVHPMYSDYANEDGIAILQDLSAQRAQAEAAGSISVNHGDHGLEPEDPSLGEPLDRETVIMDADKQQTLTDVMTDKYFTRSEASGGITADQYDSMRAEYDALDSDEKKDAYRTLHEDFAKADSFMGQIDRFETGLANGRLSVVQEDNENGNPVYSVRSNRFLELTDEQRERLQEKFEAYQNTDGQAAGLVHRITAPAIGAIMGGDVSLMLSGEFNGILNESMTEINDAEEAAEKENDGNETHHSDYGQDYDADLSGVDIAILDEQSPVEKFESMRDMANELWMGGPTGDDRVKYLEAQGFDQDDRIRIQEMINQGQEWCMNATPDMYDEAFPSEPGQSLVERESAFQLERADAAAKIMTHEGADDFMQAYNGLADGPAGIDADEASEAYDKAAHALDEAIASGAADGIDEADMAEGSARLADYVAENPDAGFITHPDSMPEPKDNEPGMTNDGPAEPDNEYGNGMTM